MIHRFTDLVTVQFYTVFIIGIIVVSFLGIGIFLKNKKSAILPLILAAITLIGFVFAVYNRYKYAKKVELFLGIFIVLAFIYNLVIYIITYIKTNKHYKIVIASSSIESIILAYLNEKGKVIYYTDDFLNLFNVNNAKQLKEVIHYIHQGDQQYSFSSFSKVLEDEKEEDYNLLIDLSNSKEMKLNISKRKIIHKGKLLGYVLINQKVKAVISESTNTLSYNYLNFVSEAMAIYESDSNKFFLNNKMQELLGTKDVSNFDEYVFFEDRKQLESRPKNDGEKSKIFYRISVQNTRVWVQESIKIENGKITKVIKETDFRSLIYNFRDYSKLVFELDQLLMTQSNFALAYISLDSLSQIKDKIGKEATLVLATQFFGSLNNEIKDLRVFEIGYYKYAFFIKNDEVYNNILKDLHNNNSNLLKSKVGFNDMIFEMKNYLGLVERRNVGNASSEVMINLAEEGLKLASNKSYNKDYSIYFSKKKQLEDEVKNIDLSDDFLDKILK